MNHKNTTPALDLRSVTVTYPDGDQTVTALDGIDFSAVPGTLTAVVGESGSGKSTLLSVAAGLVVPSAGEVLVRGRAGGTGAGAGAKAGAAATASAEADAVDLAAVDENERARVRREREGVVFQNPNLLASLKVRDQLLIADHLRGNALDRGRADELLETVGLVGMGDRRVHQLSGGQRQRVNIARALMNRPSVLLADEPTSALDRELSHEIAGLLRSVTDELGTATVLVTHDRSLLDYADVAVEMRDGTLRAIDPATAAA
ncbi:MULTISPECIES: ABC transporter ATP-binding protein [Corynebacterium]|uniref:ABC transporter ATP-binding protein n=1 Tax=Corynebacterium TaxID=1716 RepID=UPI00255104E3|nr:MULTISPECIES: ATP-binding cassette domain-containing protein [Corynebacterium]MDK6259719.1 ATP-binding cassette domain-containing protein [Corynebacterium frankenforstense]MDK8894847.1 ATP-binding cassette domain-containing protein [Corynebacterium sp. MSK006]